MARFANSAGLTIQMIGIYGGTFDPIHLGHIGLATTVLEQLPLRHIYFIPLGEAVHREQPLTSSDHRLMLIEAALNDTDDFSVDRCELERQGPSWSIQTLREFHQRFPDETLCFLMGSDAFRGVNSWRDWQALLDLAHLVVVARQGDTVQLSPEVANYLQKHRLDTIELTGENPESSETLAGQHGILWIEAEVPDISSTQVRQVIQQNTDLDGLVPPAVASIIREEQLYGR